MRLNQLADIDPDEIVVPFSNAEISSLWAENEHWQRASITFLEDTNNRYSQRK